MFGNRKGYYFYGIDVKNANVRLRFANRSYGLVEDRHNLVINARNTDKAPRRPHHCQTVAFPHYNLFKKDTCASQNNILSIICNYVINKQPNTNGGNNRNHKG